MKLSKYLTTCSGAALLLTGTFLVIVYIWEAVIQRIGEPDQSLLYWYLPFLLFGLIALKAGWKLYQSGRRRSERPHSANDES